VRQRVGGRFPLPLEQAYCVSSQLPPRSPFLESTINHVVSKRFVKKQQMQWTPHGAHLLLQTRTKVLNDDREDSFRRWYPRFRARAA
jgi:hypothetical protein